MKLRTFSRNDLWTWFKESESLPIRKILFDKFIQENTLVQQRHDLRGWLTRGVPNSGPFILYLETCVRSISYDAPANIDSAELVLEDVKNTQDEDSGLLTNFLASPEYKQSLSLKATPRKGISRESLYDGVFSVPAKNATEIWLNDRYWQWGFGSRKGAFWLTQRVAQTTSARKLVIYTTYQNVKEIPGVEQGDRWMSRARQNERTVAVLKKVLKSATKNLESVEIVILPALKENHPRFVAFKDNKDFSSAIGLDIGADLFTDPILQTDGIMYTFPIPTAKLAFQAFEGRELEVLRCVRNIDGSWVRWLGSPENVESKN
jgi:hypothetical protein